MTTTKIPFLSFLNTKINIVDFQRVKHHIAANLDNNCYICLTDVINVMWASNDEALQKAINHSLISIPDGMPLAWFARISGYREAKRISGPELFKELLQEKNNYKHFILGDTQETLGKIIKKAKKINNNISITGYSPPFKEYFTENENKIIISTINKFSPDLIWVSFGGGKQEKWMYQNIKKVNTGLMLGVGAAFDFHAGTLQRAPDWMQHIGLEWLYRLGNEPRRLFRRYLVTNTLFLAGAAWQLMFRRFLK